MSIGEYIFIALYVAVAGCLLIYGLNCYWIVFLFGRSFRTSGRQNRSVIRDARRHLRDDELPVVTTQIPLYNELNVAERIIRAAADFDYPPEKHEIQVLDDSTDETTKLVDQLAEKLRAEGKDVQVIRREDRTGFKAGALKAGMKVCRGELIAIFDSDFVPRPNFLRQAVPFLLQDPGIGLVQARWGHLNREDSLLTLSQSIGIDGHFIIEQSARAYNHLFMNFNGTAGLWRKQAIAEAGGWEADTLTEDMDLSYRAQLAGWRLYFVPQILVPAELPGTFSAFKSQQFRWAKGSIQTAFKIYPRVLQSEASWFKKVQAFFHLTHYVIHPLMLLMALLGLPLLLMAEASVTAVTAAIVGILIALATLGPNTLYFFSQYTLYRKDWWRRLLYLPILMSLGVGICISNSRAVFEALWGIESSFVRTPKAGMQTLKRYRLPTSPLPIFEVLLGCYCAVSFSLYLFASKYLVLPFLLLYTVGFLYVGLNSLREPWLAARSARS